MGGASVNKVILIGNLGYDPSMREDGKGDPIVKFSLATQNYDDTTEWHNIVVFGRLADQCKTYLSKGRQVFLEGRLSTSSWEKDGIKHYRTEVIANSVQFLGSKADDQQHAQDHDQQPSRTTERSYSADRSGTDAADDIDIPF